jgi:hypothetical protein
VKYTGTREPQNELDCHHDHILSISKIFSIIEQALGTSGIPTFAPNQQKLSRLQLVLPKAYGLLGKTQAQAWVPFSN